MATTRVDVRFEPELWREIQTFMRSSGTETASDAVRMLVEMGLPRVKDLPEAYQRAARRTADRESARKLREHLDRTLAGEAAHE